MHVNKSKTIILVSILSIMPTFFLNAQTKKAKITLVDGIVLAGYADDGAYLNFAGPAIKFSNKPWTTLIGLLPSLKFKEDKSETGGKNSVVTPSLGFGLTTSYKHLAVQIPIFYTGKTASKDGKWNMGFGLGYKF